MGRRLEPGRRRAQTCAGALVPWPPGQETATKSFPSLNVHFTVCNWGCDLGTLLVGKREEVLGADVIRLKGSRRQDTLSNGPNLGRARAGS